MQERIAILLAAAAGAHAASPVFAQEDQNESGLKESSSRPRSALKTRNESRFPFAALGAQQPQQLQITSATDLTQAVPGFTTYPVGGNMQAFILGAGTPVV